MTENQNESLLPLKSLHLPEMPSWFPLAWGWWASLAAVLIAVLLVWLFIRWRVKRMAPKKTALRMLANTKEPSSAIELLRQAALCYYPREDMAALTGKPWYVFLDRQIGKTLFERNQERWQQALYSREPIEDAQELVEHCVYWVENALPPQKGGVRRG
ncbi:DUF4381 domain-containing protein [Vibrio olivae]|uniref:DUF4381 domain-containing protein n=1 Tax=Vibrio olivae TaxID=1243002 RepID=A0ABV5HQR0_9VIBR